MFSNSKINIHNKFMKHNLFKSLYVDLNFKTISTSLVSYLLFVSGMFQNGDLEVVIFQHVLTNYKKSNNSYG